MFIQPEMTVFDVVPQFEGAVKVFRSYDEQVGECLCCIALFSSIAEVANKYDLDKTLLLAQLEKVAQSSK